MRLNPRKKVTAESGPEVRIPSPALERPNLNRLVAIAIVGFAAGVIWPRLAGLDLVPQAPRDAPPVTKSAAKPKPKAPALAKPKRAAAATQATDRIVIDKTEITSCTTASGQHPKDCGSLELERVAVGRIKALVDCDGVAGLSGTLSIGLELDFDKGRVTDVLKGSSTTLDHRGASKLLSCAKAEFQAASLKGVEHQHPRYTLYYIVEFLSKEQVRARAAAASSDADTEDDEIREATGRATVSWHVALIRETPDEGAVKARLLSGTRVFVTGRKGDWYRIKYDAHDNEGWVFKGAIGL